MFRVLGLGGLDPSPFAASCGKSWTLTIGFLGVQAVGFRFRVSKKPLHPKP